MYSFISDYSRLSRLPVTVVLNIMRTNLVARFDKPVLRRLFKSSPEQVVMRTSDEKGKGSEKLFGYGGVYECPHVLCFCLFIHVQVLALIFLCKK